MTFREEDSNNVSLIDDELDYQNNIQSSNKSKETSVFIKQRVSPEKNEVIKYDCATITGTSWHSPIKLYSKLISINTFSITLLLSLCFLNFITLETCMMEDSTLIKLKSQKQC
jgi:hypothetical protein